MSDQKYALMLRSKEVAHGCVPPRVPEGTWFVVGTDCYRYKLEAMMMSGEYHPDRPGNMGEYSLLFNGLWEAVNFRLPEDYLESVRGNWFEPSGEIYAIPVMPTYRNIAGGMSMNGYMAIGSAVELPSILLPQEERLRQWSPPILGG